MIAVITATGISVGLIAVRAKVSHRISMMAPTNAEEGIHDSVIWSYEDSSASDHFNINGFYITDCSHTGSFS